MTFILSKRYPDRTIAADTVNIRGLMKDRSTPNSNDGSYLQADWVNDMRALGDALLRHAGIKPNGEVDTPDNCQTYDALMKLVSGMINTAHKPMIGNAVGTADNFSASFPRAVTLVDGFQVNVHAVAANTSTTPRFNAGSTGVRNIVKGHNQPLLVGDISGAGHILHLMYDAKTNKWVLLNPAFGISQPESIPVGTMAYFGRTGNISGWLPMNGGEYSRATYSRLVSQCPNIILAGSTSSTFKLPDTRGLFLRVLDQGKGIDVNRKIASLQDDAIRNITGEFGCDDRQTNIQAGAFYAARSNRNTSADGGDGDWYKFIFDASRVVPTANENRPKNMTFPVYIKY